MSSPIPGSSVGGGDARPEPSEYGGRSGLVQAASDGHIFLSPKEEAFLNRRADKFEAAGVRPTITDDGVVERPITTVQNEWDKVREQAGKGGETYPVPTPIDPFA